MTGPTKLKLPMNANFDISNNAAVTCYVVTLMTLAHDIAMHSVLSRRQESGIGLHSD